MAAHLIPVFTGQLSEESTQLCNARDLHAALHVGRDFSNWVKDRIEEYGFIEREDYWEFSPNLAKNKRGRGRPTIDYHLTLDMAKELAMIENNEIGRQVRRYFIQAEKTLREKLLADLREKAEHVLPLPGVKPQRGVKTLRDGLAVKDSFKLQDRSRELLRRIMREPSKVERQNLYYHLRQINVVLGTPTVELSAIEAELTNGLPALEG